MEGFAGTNKCIEERDQARQQLKLALEENEQLKNTLRQVRKGLITNKHRLMIDRTLRSRRS